MKALTIYTATFENGQELKKTDKEIKTRLAFYNWICENRLGKKYGKVINIKARPY